MGIKRVKLVLNWILKWISKLYKKTQLTAAAFIRIVVGAVNFAVAFGT